jgi:uncharacterized protein YkwD
VPTLPPVEPATLRAQVIQAVNAERANVGCTPATENADLTGGAQAWHDYMEQYSYFNHSSTVDANWYANHGYNQTDWVMENLGFGQDTGAQVVADWMQDEGHRNTVLWGCSDPPTTFDIGVGVGDHAWVLAIGELHP